MKPSLHNLKKHVDLPNGATLGYTLIGEVVLIDKDNTRRVLDSPEAIKFLWYTVADDHPASPVIPPPSPETVADARRVAAGQRAKAAGPLRGRINADGLMEIVTEQGEVVVLPSA